MTFFMTLVLFSAQQVSTQNLSLFLHSVNDFQLFLRLFLKFIRYSHEVFVAVVFPTFSSYLSSIFFNLIFLNFFVLSFFHSLSCSAMCNAISRFSGWFNTGCSVVFRLTFSIKMSLFLDKHKISGVFLGVVNLELGFYDSVAFCIASGAKLSCASL